MMDDDWMLFNDTSAQFRPVSVLLELVRVYNTHNMVNMFHREPEEFCLVYALYVYILTVGWLKGAPLPVVSDKINIACWP